MESDGQNLHLKPHQNASKNHAKIHDFVAKGNPKSTKMMPRSIPKALLEASRLWDPPKVPTPGARHTLFGTTWAIWGSILDPAGRQGGPKIEHFGTRKHQKSEKWCPGRGVGKSLKFWWNFNRKMEAWEVQNHWCFIVCSIDSCFRRFLKNIEFLIENASQNASKIN